MAPWLDAIKRRRYGAAVPRGYGLWLCLLLASLLPNAVLSTHAHARDMHLRLGRLSQGACEQTLSGADDFALSTNGSPTLTPDNGAYAQLVSQLAFAVAPALLMPVTTRGPSGFDIGLDTSVTGIDKGASYWKRGSAGSGPSTCDGRNSDVSGALVGNRLRFNKGLPLGLSIGANLGLLHGLGLYTLGGELKLALLEGATEPYSPSLAVRVATNALVGEPALMLSSNAIDVIVSKEFAALYVLHVVPYLGLGALLNYARSQPVDLTSNIDAQACAAGTDPVCNAQGLGASSEDLAHDRAFNKLFLMRYRAVLGLWLRVRAFAFAAEASIDLVRPDRADGDLKATTARQWSLSFAPSLSF
jgi:hypothetical protein